MTSSPAVTLDTKGTGDPTTMILEKAFNMPVLLKIQLEHVASTVANG